MTTTNSDDWRPSGGGRSLVALVPDYDGVTAGNQKSLLRLGAHDPTDEANIFANLPDNWTAVSDSTKKVKELLVANGQPYPGWLEYTDGDRTVVTRGNSRDAIAGDYKQYIRGNALIDVGGKYVFRIGSGTVETWNADPVYYINFYAQPGLFTAGKQAYRKREMGHVAADSYWFGDTETFYGGFKFDLTFGMTAAAFIGGKIDFSAAVSASVNFGYALEFGVNFKYSNVKGGDMRVATDIETKARKSIHLRVKAGTDGVSTVLRKLADNKATILAVAAGAGAAAALSIGTVIPPVTDDGVSPVAATALGLSGVAFLVGLAVSLGIALRDKASPKISASEIKMDDAGVTIAHNNAAGVMQANVRAGDGAANPGAVWLENHHGSIVSLKEDQNVVIEAKKDLYFQTDSGNSLLKLLDTGDIRIKATQANIQGNRITLGAGNELQIG